VNLEQIRNNKFEILVGNRTFGWYLGKFVKTLEISEIPSFHYYFHWINARLYFEN